MGWADLENGDLLDAAEREGFAVILTADKSIKRQQAMVSRSVSLIVLRAFNNAIESHIVILEDVEKALTTVSGGEVVEVFHLDMKP